MAEPSCVPTASRCDLPWKSIEGNLRRKLPNQCAVHSKGSADTSNSRSDKLVQDDGSCLVYSFSKIADRRIERLDDSFGNSR
jgi:hypothetical protein